MYKNSYHSAQRSRSFSPRPRGAAQSQGARHFGGSSYSRSNRGNRGPRKKFIDPARFINHEIAEATDIQYTPTHKFSEFGLTEKLAGNIAALGYETPTAIQDKTIPLAMNGRDVVGLANTGTGKTAAFLLPILNKLYARRTTGSVLVMAPTRELAQQIDAEFKRFSADMKLYSAVCVGGANIGRQIRDLRRRPHVVIGTPGRLKDLIGRGELKLDETKTLVLDEADRMLDMGFVHDIREIIGLLPEAHQTLCFSATITPAVDKIIQEVMNEPITISVKVSETNDHIYQDVIRFSDNDHKRELLANMLSDDEYAKVLVFGETKFGVQRLADSLSRQGIAAVAIHGNKSQSQRERALRQFKNQEFKVLVATDVAARGLDIPDISHVINYDTPSSYEDYVHRIGRTGRAGKTGKALTFIPAA